MNELIHNPGILRRAYEEKHGDAGVYILYGALFANVSPETIERLYREVLAGEELMA